MSDDNLTGMSDIESQLLRIWRSYAAKRKKRLMRQAVLAEAQRTLNRLNEQLGAAGLPPACFTDENPIEREVLREEAAQEEALDAELLMAVKRWLSEVEP